MAIDVRRPRVLANIQSWTPTLAARELGVIRTHLRGLGAELTIAAAAGAWWIGPDDEPRPADADELVALARLPRDRDAVVVVDGAGSVRFSYTADGPLAASLGAALAAAVDALYATRPPRVTFNRREWALACLCTGFALSLPGCQRKAAAPPPPPPAPTLSGCTPSRRRSSRTTASSAATAGPARGPTIRCASR